MKQKVLKNSIWGDKDSRNKDRRVLVLGFENLGGGRRARIQRLGAEDKPEGRVTTIDPENLQRRFNFLGSK